jgi:HlyD family type I secretion membrane fusion protein
MTYDPILPARHTRLCVPLLLTSAIVAVFFVGFGGWSTLAPLAGGAIAPGIVVTAADHKTIKHLEGGIVRVIYVQDGSQVAAGETLVQLDDTTARAEHEQLLAQWRTQKVLEARLVAEQNHAPDVAMPAELLDRTSAVAATALLADERLRFRTRRQSLVDQEAVLIARMAQARQQIEALAAEMTSATAQLGLIDQETGGVRELLRKGFETKPHLLLLERTKAGLEGQIASDQANIRRIEQAIVELNAQRAGLTSRWSDEIASALAQARAELASLGERLKAARDRLDRTTITAPVAGTIVALRVKTPGGVIGAGEALMDIVPAADILLIEARVAPNDIDEVRPGLGAQVRLLAYRSRTMPRLVGAVQDVSADRLVDAKTGQAYYTAQVNIDPATLPPDVKLTPGMPAEALIVTGNRTLLHYLLQPVLDVVQRGMRQT